MNKNAVIKNKFQGVRKYDFLHISASPRHHLSVTFMVCMYDILNYDGPLIKVVVDKVGGRSDELHTPVIGLCVWFGSDKCRKEGVMDVDDPV